MKSGKRLVLIPPARLTDFAVRQAAAQRIKPATAIVVRVGRRAFTVRHYSLRRLPVIVTVSRALEQNFRELGSLPDLARWNHIGHLADRLAQLIVGSLAFRGIVPSRIRHREILREFGNLPLDRRLTIVRELSLAITNDFCSQPQQRAWHN